MSDTSTITAAPTGVFTRDQVEILSARKGEADWVREARLAAYEEFAAQPMPQRSAEDWRYTYARLNKALDLEALAFAEERGPLGGIDALPEGLRALVDGGGEAAARLGQVDGSLVWREMPEELAAQGVIFTSLENAVREHPELVRGRLGAALAPDAGKFAAMNAAFWTAGLFVYVPKDVKIALPLRTWRWMGDAGTAVFGRTLVVAEAGAEVSVVDELGSTDFGRAALHVGAAEIFAEEGAKVIYVASQRFGRGVLHLQTDRLSAGRDAKITTLYSTLGSDVTRADVRCTLREPGSHVDMLGIYIGQGAQHFDHETLQDHVAPHASSNLLFKGALDDESRSVFRGLIRVHPKAQRTDAYQTNRNLVLSAQARADSLPNLEIQADDVRCSHAATVGQLDQEEVFYLLSRGIPKGEAVRLVVFGFFSEVLDQLPLDGVRRELLGAVERKLARRF
ncbi:MAG TPA: Fe-S cluster assembly protein SufD [Longimicrobium sp.]|nr:Fe-S cluster assembly protein SufD [Longimicrobium sp.]